MATKWTDEQLSAIETRGCNLLVAAAAGSGKTAVLVERIIKMITDNQNPIDIDKLLVVTFTNAAASEMRERIGDAISKELEKDPTSSVLQRQLALLNRASITTMHSFCLEVIKNNFHLIDLDPAFRIGDETECTLIKQELVADLFEERYDDEDEKFLALVEAYGGSKNDDKLHDVVLRLYHFSMSGPWPEEWLKEKAEDFNVLSIEQLDKKAWVNILKQSMRIEVESFLEILNEAANTCEDTIGLETYLENINDDILQIESINKSLDGSLSEIQKVLSNIKFSTLKRVKKSEIGDENSQQKVKELREIVKKSIKELREKVFYVELDEAIVGIKKMYPLIRCLTNLVIEFSNKYREKKREKSILDFNDLEHLCLKILVSRDNEKNILPSKVALDFREKFQEILVDEYQDSNNVQETIINMVSRKNTEKPNVFMVGDVKQSIYRFRQAKPELFLEKYNTYKEISSEDNRKIMLYKNFRSRKEIIDGANYIFKALMSEIVGELNYDEKEALNLGADYKKIEEDNILLHNESLDDIKIAGDIELHILNKAGEKFDDIKNSSDMSDEDETIIKEEDLDSIQLEARIVAHRINQLMNSKDGNTYMVWVTKLLQ